MMVFGCNSFKLNSQNNQLCEKTRDLFELIITTQNQNMRTKAADEKIIPKRAFKYTVQALIQEIKLNIKFPCKLTLCWNYGEGSVTTVKPAILEKGIAKFTQTLSFPVSITYDEQKQQYLEHKNVLEVFIVTENGNSLAGYVTIDLGAWVGNHEKKELFQIQRCPDRSATIRMKILPRFINQKSSKPIPQMYHHEKDNSMNQLSEGLSRVEQSKKTDSQTLRNKQLIEKELGLLKSKASQFQVKYKNQKAEREKVNDLLKNKEEIYFTLKTQIKRKEIQMEGMMRSMEEYKKEYERLKLQNSYICKDKDRLQSGIQAIQRSSYDKISRLESQNVSIFKKFQKLSSELEKCKRQKDSVFANYKQKIDGNSKQKQSLSDLVRQLKKQKQQILKLQRTDKQNYQKTIKQLNKKITQFEQQVTQSREKYSNVSKKFSKTQEVRIQEINKANIRVVELEKYKQSLSMQLSSLKKDSNKKQRTLTENIKNLQKQLTEERSVNLRLTASIADFQSQKTSNTKQIQKLRQHNQELSQEKVKLQKQVEHLKYQISGLNDIMLAKSQQLKNITLKGKGSEEELKKKQQQFQQKLTETRQKFQKQLREHKKTQQNKYLNLTNNFIKKERDLEDALSREQKLNLDIQSIKQQLKKVQVGWRQKIETLKKNEQYIKQELFQLSRKKQEDEQQLVEKLRQMELEVYSLNESLNEAKDNEFRLLEKEERMKAQLQQLYQLYNQLNINSLKLQEEVEQYKDRLQDNQRNQSVINQQIESSEARHTKFIKQMKEKIVQLESQKFKLNTLIRDKQKSNDSFVKTQREEVESLKKQIYKKQLEIKKIQDDARANTMKQKLKLDGLEIQLDKAQTELIKINGTLDRNKILVEHLQTELKNYKQNFKSVTREKQDLIRRKEEIQIEKRDLEEQKIMYQTSLSNKQRDIKILKSKLDQVQLQLKQLQLLKGRSLPILQQLCQVVWRLTGSQGSSQLGNDYDSMIQIRKGLLILETKLFKSQESSIQQSNLLVKQVQNYQEQISKLNTEVMKLKTQVSTHKKNQQQQLSKNNLANIQNQSLHDQINELEAELDVLKNSNLSLNIKLKDESQRIHHYQLEIQIVIQKYQILIEQTRTQIVQKYQKQKKELNTSIRNLEARLEEQEQKNFTLQLDNQKIQQYVRREEEGKKILERMYQLQRENIQLIQSQKQAAQKTIDQNERLQLQKSSVMQGLKNTIVRLQKNNANLQTQIEKLSAKNRQLMIDLKQKDMTIEKMQHNIFKMNQQYAEQNLQLRDQKQKLLESQIRLKNEVIKIKSQLSLIKKNHEDDKNRLLTLQSSVYDKKELDQQLEDKKITIAELQSKQQCLNQEINRLNQQIQQLKLEFDQTLNSKQSEVMQIQEQLYTLNSKQNLRMLREAQILQKYRIVQQEKKFLLKQVQQYKEKLKCLQEPQRSVNLMTKRDTQISVGNILMDDGKSQEEIRRFMSSKFQISKKSLF